MSEPDEHWEDPDDRMYELESRVDELEDNLSAAENTIEEYFGVLIGLIVGLMESVYVKAMSESDESREDFSQILESAIQEDILKEHPSKEHRKWARRLMKKLSGLLKQPSGDRLLKLYSRQPDRDGRKASKLSLPQSSGSSNL